MEAIMVEQEKKLIKLLNKFLAKYKWEHADNIPLSNGFTPMYEDDSDMSEIEKEVEDLKSLIN
jgi:hypothetical protein